jgi:hypothetical protein
MAQISIAFSAFLLYLPSNNMGFSKIIIDEHINNIVP